MGIRLAKKSVALVVASVAFGIGAGVIAKNEPKYVGTAVCMDCHTDSHPAIVKYFMQTAHRAAMTDAAKNPKVIVADFGAGCPIKKTDVRYVLGLGKVYQNYLDKNLRLLPAKWDAVGKKWIRIDSVDGAAQCVGCHVTNFNPKTKTWSELGVGCESCHGPGSIHADSMDAKDIKNLKKLPSDRLNMVCGQCHSHGTDLTGKYAFPTAFRPGDDLARHMKFKVAGEGVANSQYNQFVKSKHAVGGIIKCTTCHDPHGDKAKSVHQLRQPVNQLCLGCHSVDIGESKAVTSIQEHAPSAKPSDTCATCHMPAGNHAFNAK